MQHYSMALWTWEDIMNNGFAVLLDTEPQQKQYHSRFSNKQLLE